ncbi:MAG: hypothetical protein DME35_00395 [Verrucomicrobia bacterium]|nr:MAG: hypothetical protein DME35_00395 [Verrucomicrobiota bacterium]
MSFDRIFFCRFCPANFFAGAIACFSLVFVAKVLAQEAVGTAATSAPSSEPVAEMSAESSVPILTPAADSNLYSSNDLRKEVSAEPRRFQYGFKVTVRGVYDDNINISQTNRVSDYYFSIEPVLTLGLGDITGAGDNYIRLDYAPALFLFADHSEDDAVQHLIRLQGQHQFARLTVALAEEIAILDGTDLRSVGDLTAPGIHANTDVSGRTKFQTYRTSMNASYDLSGKTFLSTGFNSLVTEYDSSSLFSSANFSENLFINYRYSDKVVVGIGGTGGYDVVDDPNPAQTFEQANARISYQPSGKISVNVSGGVEFRQFEHNSRHQYVTPVFELALSYQPFDPTTITLSGSRSTYNSGALAGQDFAQTSISASMRQRFLQRFYIAVSAGYQNSDYFSTVNGIAANRQDNYYFIEPALDFSITRFWTFGGYYLHRQNDSASQNFSFFDDQVGFRTALTF